MNEILIFAGTTEGRELSEKLAACRISHTVCVATEYGENLLGPDPFRTIHCGRMDQEEIGRFIRSGNFLAVVDATHPYADVITENIRQAAKGTDIPCLRLKRDRTWEPERENIRYFDSHEECAKALEETEGNVLLTTGSKALSDYCMSKRLRSRLYVRVLPSMESLRLCMDHGLTGKQILAMQGPFTAQMNEAIFRQYGISCVVTKESGKQGGFEEKLEAAEKAAVRVFVIGHLKEEEGYDFDRLWEKLEEICGHSLQAWPVAPFMEITLIGIGMGGRETLTREAEKKILEADILSGAERLISSYKARIEKKPFYQAKQIIPYLEDVQERFKEKKHIKAAILFSGDSGFYSGCRLVYHELTQEVQNGHLDAAVHILPGISSISYLAACTGESYEDAAVYSIHGKELKNLVRRIKEREKTFLLMSGVSDIRHLGKLLTEADMTECRIVAGYQLSYENQKIKILTPEECCREEEEGLFTCLVKNPKAAFGLASHGLSDEEFIRERIPMTKEEVREISICKLKLHKKAVVYDVGSGTGSVAVEIAGLSDDIQVYAIEQKREAADLISANKEKFCLDNITIVRAEAPKGLEDLPAATHAFIGGSNGRLKEIMSVLYQKNPHMRVVINAVSMETICEIRELLCRYPTIHWEVVEVHVSRAKEAGNHHLMRGENPIWISVFHFTEEREEENEIKQSYDCCP